MGLTYRRWLLRKARPHGSPTSASSSKRPKRRGWSSGPSHNPDCVVSKWRLREVPMPKNERVNSGSVRLAHPPESRLAPNNGCSKRCTQRELWRGNDAQPRLAADRRKRCLRFPRRSAPRLRLNANVRRLGRPHPGTPSRCMTTRDPADKPLADEAETMVTTPSDGGKQGVT